MFTWSVCASPSEQSVLLHNGKSGVWRAAINPPELKRSFADSLPDEDPIPAPQTIDEVAALLIRQKLRHEAYMQDRQRRRVGAENIY